MANQTHKQLLQSAEKAIDDVFSDTRVSRKTTYVDLQDLRADIDIKLEALKADMKREDEEVGNG
jgi:hypothetical protein